MFVKIESYENKFINLNNLISLSIEDPPDNFPKKEENYRLIAEFNHIITKPVGVTIQEERLYSISLMTGSLKNCQKELNRILKKQEGQEKKLARMSGVFGAIAGAIIAGIISLLIYFNKFTIVWTIFRVLE